VSAGQVPEEDFPQVVGRISFFVNAGIRFVEEVAKMRAFVEMWDRITRERYGVEDPKLRRFRYGVQVNSLGLTEQQPENNISRILIEMLGVTLSKDARARAVQLPAWNEALGLPRPWDQQLSLRMQQILAFETDLLENGDLFEGSVVMERKVAGLIDEAQALLDEVLEHGGAIDAVDLMKGELVRSNAERLRRIESGEQQVIGVNAFTTAAPSPLVDEEGGILKVDDAAEAEQIALLDAWRSARDESAVSAALRSSVGGRVRRQPDAGEHRVREGRGRRPVSGRRPCATCSASTAGRPASASRRSRRAGRCPRRWRTAAGG
jgi:ethylmalonyl-CoA mutase